jgi:hypothetical protein
MKIPKWQKRLNASERKHIRDTTSHNTLHELKTNIEFQRHNVHVDPCWLCRQIANKLGI